MPQFLSLDPQIFTTLILSLTCCYYLWHLHCGTCNNRFSKARESQRLPPSCQHFCINVFWFRARLSHFLCPVPTRPTARRILRLLAERKTCQFRGRDGRIRGFWTDMHTLARAWFVCTYCPRKTSF